MKKLISSNKPGIAEGCVDGVATRQWRAILTDEQAGALVKAARSLLAADEAPYAANPPTEQERLALRGAWVAVNNAAVVRSRPACPREAPGVD